jgi:hypothetical protein
MARSSVAAAMSFRLASGGVLGLLTSKSAFMRSRACLPSSRARPLRVEASPAMEARSSRTARYYSASLASSSRAWVSCALMSAPSAVRGEARLAPHPGAVQFPGWGNLSVASFRRVRDICLVIGDHDEALPRGAVAPGAGVDEIAEPVVCGVKEPLEHYWVQHAGKVPLRVPVRSGGWQVAGGAVVRLVVGGCSKVPCRWDMAARMTPVRRHVGAGGRGVRHCGAAQAEG